MCENCGCHHRLSPLKPPARIKAVAPHQWHVHADGTAHRHAHGHPGEETIQFTRITDSPTPLVKEYAEATVSLSNAIQDKA